MILYCSRPPLVSYFCRESLVAAYSCRESLIAVPSYARVHCCGGTDLLNKGQGYIVDWKLYSNVTTSLVALAQPYNRGGGDKASWLNAILFVQTIGL